MVMKHSEAIYEIIVSLSLAIAVGLDVAKQ